MVAKAKTVSAKEDTSPETDIMTVDKADQYSIDVRNLREKKYVVRPIRRKGAWVGPDHDSAFMNDGAKMGIVVPVLAGNVLRNPMPEFTSKDIKLLAEELGLEDVQRLNIHVPKSYWRGKTVTLDRNGLHLHLEKVNDLVNFLILRSDSERIAPSWTVRFDRGTYKFALVEEGEELQDKVSNLEEKKNAYILFGKMDSSIDKMKDFLYVYYLQKRDAKGVGICYDTHSYDEVRKVLDKKIIMNTVFAFAFNQKAETASSMKSDFDLTEKDKDQIINLKQFQCMAISSKGEKWAVYDLTTGERTTTSGTFRGYALPSLCQHQRGNIK